MSNLLLQGITLPTLRKISLLEGIDESALEHISKFFQYRTVDKGETILHQGSPGESMLFLLSGRLQVVDFSEDGREIGLSFLEASDYFGELSIIDNLPRSASVVAIEKSTFASLPRAQALDLIYNNPLIAERLLNRLAGVIRRATIFRSILGNPNAFQRVYLLLNYLAVKSQSGLVLIERMPAQHEIAIMVNTSRETVSRALNALIKDGVIEKDLKRLIVRKQDVLRRAMSGN